MSMDYPPGQMPDSVASLAAARRAENTIVSFHRRELTLILNVYGRMLGLGIARDYAIDHMKDRAVFSIFRRTSENPLYRIEKNPKLARKQGAFSIITATGLILKRGGDLRRVLASIDKKRLTVVGD